MPSLRRVAVSLKYSSQSGIAIGLGSLLVFATGLGSIAISLASYSVVYRSIGLSCRSSLVSYESS